MAKRLASLSLPASGLLIFNARKFDHVFATIEAGSTYGRMRMGSLTKTCRDASLFLFFLADLPAPPAVLITGRALSRIDVLGMDILARLRVAVVARVGCILH
jgi:hypothetical protein